jgi:hypothetical protein
MGKKTFKKIFSGFGTFGLALKVPKRYTEAPK